MPRCHALLWLLLLAGCSKDDSSDGGGDAGGAGASGGAGINRSWINIPLRAGLSRNLARRGSGTAVTAGAGINLLHVMLDVSASVTPKSTSSRSVGAETEKIPQEAAVAFQFSVLFGGPAEDKRRGGRSSAAPTNPEPVSYERVKENSDKAQQELDQNTPTYSPSGQ